MECLKSLVESSFFNSIYLHKTDKAIPSETRRFRGVLFVYKTTPFRLQIKRHHKFYFFQKVLLRIHSKNAVVSCTIQIKHLIVLHAEGANIGPWKCIFPCLIPKRKKEIYYENRILLYYCAYGILGDVQLSEGAVSEAFLALIKNIDKIVDNEELPDRWGYL